MINRLKAAAPHFVAHVRALAPKIIMRRYSDLGKDRDPGLGIFALHSHVAQSVEDSKAEHQPTALAGLRNPTSSARRVLRRAWMDIRS